MHCVIEKTSKFHLKKKKVQIMWNQSYDFPITCLLALLLYQIFFYNSSPIHIYVFTHLIKYKKILLNLI